MKAKIIIEKFFEAIKKLGLSEMEKIDLLVKLQCRIDRELNSEN